VSGLQADTVAAVWTAAAAIHREKNTVKAAAAAGLQPQQAAANKPKIFLLDSRYAVISIRGENTRWCGCSAGAAHCFWQSATPRALLGTDKDNRVDQQNQH
jgi:hypothetical protein